MASIEELQHEVSKLNNRIRALGKTIEDKDKIIEQLRRERDLLVAQKNQWDVEKSSQEQIVQLAIGNSNSVNQTQAEEIQRLKERLRKYESE